MRPPHRPLPPSPPLGRGWRGFILALGAVLILGYYFLFSPRDGGFFPSCFIYRITGYRCPGCGSQRALHALLHGRWQEALGYNYFLLVILPLGLLIGYMWMFPERTKRLQSWLRHPLSLLALIILTLLWVVGRNLLGC